MSIGQISAETMQNLGNRSLSAFFWGAGGSVARIVLQLCTQIALARILGPEQYGLFAIGAIVVSFSNFFSDIGIAYGLIQKTEANSRDLRFVFTWQLIIGSLVTLAVAGFSRPIAEFFGEPNAHEVVFALAVVCLLNALAAPSNNMLKRNLDFKRVQIAQLAGYIGGYIVIGLPLALAGAQVWALVVAWISQAIIIFLILYTSAKHSLRPLFWYEDAKSLSSYGALVLVTNITNWTIGNIDRVIIGRFFSGREIGLYATTYNLLQSPTSSLLAVIQPVFFSASSRVGDDKTKIVNGYYALLSAICLCVFPIFAAVSSVAETFVLAVYGDKWIESAVVFRPLALAMPLFLIWGMTTPLLWSGGTPAREFKTQLPVALLWIAVSWFAAHHSMAMVGWAVCGMFALRCFIMIFTASKSLELPWVHLWRCVRGGLSVSVACAALCAGLDYVLRDLMPEQHASRLILVIVASASFYLLLLTRVPSVISLEFAELIVRLADRCPKSVAHQLRMLARAKAPNVDR